MRFVRFNKDHEWVRLDGSEAVVGITDYAQSQLSDVVHFDLPQVGKRIEQSKQVAAIESVKVAHDLYAPIPGEVTGVNAALGAASEAGHRPNRRQYSNGAHG
jgi:glycine cleavage system H protein